MPDDLELDADALDFMNERCLALDPADRSTAKDLLAHPFITTCDPSWTFAESIVGKEVGSIAPPKMEAPGAGVKRGGALGSLMRRRKKDDDDGRTMRVK